MAHFAQINENNVVTQVIVVSNDDCPDPAPDNEAQGQAFIASLGLTGEWKQTSYNARFRKNYAGIGFTFREDIDAFVSPQPYASWTLNEETAKWEAPIARPEEGAWHWNETTQQWDEYTL